MPMSTYVSGLRAHIGHDLLLLPAVTAVIRDGAAFLLARRSGSEVWGLIGGGIEPGEEPRDAVVREVLEEIGVRPTVHGTIDAYGGAQLTVEYDNGDRVSYITIAFDCSIPRAAEVVFLDHELTEVAWFTLGEISALEREPAVDRILLDATRRAGVSGVRCFTDVDDSRAVDHLALAERFIAETYPGATIAVVAGSTSRGERTASSDIDLLLIGDALFDDETQTSEAATHSFDGEIFEVFAYTPTGFDEWAERSVAQHRPVIVHMLVEGTVVRDEARLVSLREHWRSVIDAGPLLSEQESSFRRYVITDVLDDLRDATDPLEQRVLASVLFERTAELMLLADGCWIAAGKWLPRRLRDLDTERTDRLSIPLLRGDYATFADCVEEELQRAGGRVQTGFVR